MGVGGSIFKQKLCDRTPHAPGLGDDGKDRVGPNLGVRSAFSRSARAAVAPSISATKGHVAAVHWAPDIKIDEDPHIQDCFSTWRRELVHVRSTPNVRAWLL